MLLEKEWQKYLAENLQKFYKELSCRAHARKHLSIFDKTAAVEVRSCYKVFM